MSDHLDVDLDVLGDFIQRQIVAENRQLEAEALRLLVACVPLDEIVLVECRPAESLWRAGNLWPSGPRWRVMTVDQLAELEEASTRPCSPG